METKQTAEQALDLVISDLVREACPWVFGRHDFSYEPGRCSVCQTPRYWTHSKRKEITSDKTSGGSVSEVEATQVDETNLPCIRGGWKDIQLADILKTFDFNRRDIAIDSVGEFLEFDDWDTNQYKHTGFKWDLSKSYSKQSERTKTFIAKILTLKK